MNIVSKKLDGPSIAYAVSGDMEFFITIPVNDTNIEEEKRRLKEQIENRKEYLRAQDLKLLNADFIRNAPEKIVRIEQDKRAQAADQLKKLEEKYHSLSFL
jgi:valyl-tRNA synthetase